MRLKCVFCEIGDKYLNISLKKCVCQRLNPSWLTIRYSRGQLLPSMQKQTIPTQFITASAIKITRSQGKWCYFHGLFNNTFSVKTTLYQMIRWKMNWKGCERKQLWPNQGTTAAFAWKEWWKPRKEISHGSLCPAWGLNQASPKHKHKALLSPGGPKQPWEPVRIVGMPAKIQSEHLPNTTLEISVLLHSYRDGRSYVLCVGKLFFKEAKSCSWIMLFVVVHSIYFMHLPILSRRRLHTGEEILLPDKYSLVLVTRRRVWNSNWIYWILLTCNYKSL